MLIDLKCIKYNSYVNYIIKEEGENISLLEQFICMLLKLRWYQSKLDCLRY